MIRNEGDERPLILHARGGELEGPPGLIAGVNTAIAKPYGGKLPRTRAEGRTKLSGPDLRRLWIFYVASFSFTPLAFGQVGRSTKKVEEYKDEILD